MATYDKMATYGSAIPKTTAALGALLLLIACLLGVIIQQNNTILTTFKEIPPHTSHAQMPDGGAGHAHSSQAQLPDRGAAAVTSQYFVAPRSRNALGALLQARGYTTGVELGVLRGHFSNLMLTTWPSCTKYYLVDLWAYQENYKDVSNAAQGTHDERFVETQRNLQRFASKTVFIRNYTSNAVHQIPDGIDFVYVDARHDYCGAYEDIALYWPKIRSGGMMAGHDYLESTDVRKMAPTNDWSVCMNGTVHYGAVKGAVDDFFRPLGLPVFLTYQDPPSSSWIVLKP